jgi:hypothetical protein
MRAIFIILAALAIIHFEEVIGFSQNTFLREISQKMESSQSKLLIDGYQLIKADGDELPTSADSSNGYYIRKEINQEDTLLWNWCKLIIENRMNRLVDLKSDQFLDEVDCSGLEVLKFQNIYGQDLNYFFSVFNLHQKFGDNSQSITEQSNNSIELCLINTENIKKGPDEISEFKLRNLDAVLLDQDGDQYSPLKELATTAIVITLVAAAVYYVSYVLKGLDPNAFWVLLHFIQMVYVTIMLEINHPANLIYFLDRLDHCKLDLNYIPEFFGIRESIYEELYFRPDRQAFKQIEYEYGSVLVNLAYYSRILWTVFLLHFVLKIVLLFKPTGDHPIFDNLMKFKEHISSVFYVRYLMEISLFLWLAVLIEFVSTERNSELKRFSLAIAIIIFIFLLGITYMLIYAFIVERNKEADRGALMGFYMIKRGLFSSVLIGFAYVSKEWQLSLLLAIQVASTITEIFVRKGKWPFNRVVSHLPNFVLITYYSMLFMFLNKNPNPKDSQAEATGIFISVFIFIYASIIILYGVIRLIKTIIRDWRISKEIDVMSKSYEVKNSEPNNIIDEEHHEMQNKESQIDTSSKGSKGKVPSPSGDNGSPPE